MKTTLKAVAIVLVMLPALAGCSTRTSDAIADEPVEGRTLSGDRVFNVRIPLADAKRARELLANAGISVSMYRDDGDAILIIPDPMLRPALEILREKNIY
ncbi:MAG: hypothetical protein GC159_04820 [Phycisphaera sp.]|nr:hypothetical protein [Phycisphaera sp.]